MYSATLNGQCLVTKPEWHEVAQLLIQNGLASFAHNTLFTMNPGVTIVPGDARVPLRSIH